MFTEHLGMDPITGKRVLVTRRGFPTKKDAQSKLSELKFQFDHGAYARTSLKTYGEVFDDWVLVYRETVRPSTLRSTLSHFRVKILPVFGDVKLKDITPRMCQAFANRMSKERKHYRELYQYAARIYEYAYKMGMVSAPNPFHRIFHPKADQTERKKEFFDGSELLPFLSGIDDPLWRTFFRVLAFTGIRKGECLALLWSDIDFKAQTLHVKRTVATGIGGEQYTDRPKTKSGDRLLSLDDETVQVLKDWQASGRCIHIGGLIFSSTSGKLLDAHSPYQVLKKELKKQGIKKNITVHSFRHTHCSLLFEAGWSLKDVQERMGWADANTCLNVYYHVTDTRKVRSVEEFARYVKSL